MKQKMGKSILDFLKSSKILEFKSVSKQQFIHKVVSLRSKKFNSISFYNVCTRRKLLRNKCFLSFNNLSLQHLERHWKSLSIFTFMIPAFWIDLLMKSQWVKMTQNLPRFLAWKFKLFSNIFVTKFKSKFKLTNSYFLCKIENSTFAHCLKITQNIAFEFWHFPPIFVLLKLTCLVTLFDRKLQVFKNSPKWTIFGIFE